MIGGAVVGKVSFAVDERGLTAFINRLTSAEARMDTAGKSIEGLEGKVVSFADKIKIVAAEIKTIDWSINSKDFADSVKELRDNFSGTKKFAKDFKVTIQSVSTEVGKLKQKLDDTKKSFNSLYSATSGAVSQVNGVKIDSKFGKVATDVDKLANAFTKFNDAATNYKGFSPVFERNVGTIVSRLLKGATNAAEFRQQLVSLGRESAVAAARIKPIVDALKGVSSKVLSVNLRVTGQNDPTLQWVIANSHRIVNVHVRHTSSGNITGGGGGGGGDSSGVSPAAAMALGGAAAPFLRRFGRGLGLAAGITGGGVMTAGYAANSILTTGRETQGANAQMLAVSRTLDNYLVNRDFVRKESDRLGLDYTDSARGYAQMFGAAKKSFGDGQIRAMFTGMNQYFLANRLSAEQQKGATTAINQMLSKQKVTAEELKGQLAEHGLPGVIDLFAQAAGFGNDTAKLFKAMEKGKVGIDTIQKALMLMGEESTRMRDELGRSPVEMYQQSSQAAQIRAKNAWAEFSLQVMEGGLDQFVATLFDDIAKGLKIILPYAKAFGKFLKDAYDGFEYLKIGAIVFKDTVVELFKWFMLLIGPAIAAIAIFGRGFLTARDYILAARGAVGLLGTAFTWLGMLIKRHPIIAALTAILFVSNQLTKYYKGEDSWFTLLGAGMQVVFAAVDLGVTRMELAFIRMRAALFEAKMGVSNFFSEKFGWLKFWGNNDTAQQNGTPLSVPGFTSDMGTALQSLQQQTAPTPFRPPTSAANLQQQFSIFVGPNGAVVQQGNRASDFIAGGYNPLGVASIDTTLPA